MHYNKNYIIKDRWFNTFVWNSRLTLLFEMLIQYYINESYVVKHAFVVNRQVVTFQIIKKKILQTISKVETTSSQKRRAAVK